MAHAPLISIITVTYNAAQTVVPTLQSVASQTFTDYEHLVMDGNSKDDTAALVSRHATPRTRFHSEPDRGIYDAMNKGLHQAAGKYVIFLNAGDRFHSPDTLQTIADTIARNGQPGVVYGQTYLVDADGRYLGPRHLTAPEKLTAQSFATGMKVCHQAFVARRDLCPDYDLQWRFSADYEWCIKILRKSENNAYTGNVLIDYLYEGMTTQNRKASLMERYKIMCRNYGTLPTLLRHIAFIPRFVGNKLKMKQSK